MQRTLISIGMVLFVTSSVYACPGLVVPVDPKDPARKSIAWKAGLKHFQAQRYSRAHKALLKTSARLEKDVEALFHPKPEKVVKNTQIQKWFQRHVYTQNPSVLIHNDRFTYPPVVWWALTDTACRLGRYEQALTALQTLRQIRPGVGLNYHEAYLLAQTNALDRAKVLLDAAPPDSFATPFINGVIAARKGDKVRALEFFGRAHNWADLKDRRNAIEKERKKLTNG